MHIQDPPPPRPPCYFISFGDLNKSESGLEFLDGFLLLLGDYFLVLDLTLGTTLESTDQLSKFLVIVEVSSEGSSQVVDLTLIFLPHVSQSHHCSILLVDQSAEGGLPLDEAVGYVHLSAEVGQPDDKLDGIDVVGNDDQLGFLVLNQLGDVIESEFQVVRLGVLHFLFCIKADVLSALNLASPTNRARRCLASSGEYFLRSLKRTLAEYDGNGYLGSYRGPWRTGQWQGAPLFW